MRRPVRVVVILASVALAIAAGVFASAGEARSTGRVGTIAFLRLFDGFTSDPRVGLFVVRADGSGLHRVTPAGSTVWGYRWSPDGRWLAYIERAGSLWVVRPDGSGRRRLIDGTRLPVSGPEWAPDGKTIAVYDEASGAIYLVTLEGGTRRLLMSGDVGDPKWSPRGDRIGWSTPSGGVWTIRPDGSDAKPLFGGRGGLWGFSWSADGLRIALTSNSIYVSNADGSNLRRVTRAYSKSPFVWSPDGQTILYGRTDSSGIHTIRFDGRKDFRVTHDPIPNTSWETLSWSPNGRSIAYTSGPTGSSDIYLIDANGKNRLQLTGTPHVDNTPSWQPN